MQQVGIYDDDNPPHLEAKNYINHELDEYKPSKGIIILLDGIHFRSSKQINEPKRTKIIQFNYEHYVKMKNDEIFGKCVEYNDLASYLETENEELGIVYADVCGSIKEMIPILEQLSTKKYSEKAIVACTICARDGEKKDENSLDFTTELLIQMNEYLPDKWKPIGDKKRIKYGNMCTIIMQKN